MKKESITNNEEKKIDEVEIIENTIIEISKVIRYPFVAISILWGFIMLITMLKLGAYVFDTSLGTGLILFFTIGFPLFAFPVGMAFMATVVSKEWSSEADNIWEMYGKYIFGSIAMLIGSYILMLIISFLMELLLS